MLTLIGLFSIVIIIVLIISRGLRKSLASIIIIVIVAPFIGELIRYTAGSQGVNLLTNLKSFIPWIIIFLLIFVQKKDRFITTGIFSRPILIFLLGYIAFSLISENSFADALIAILTDVPSFMLYYFIGLYYFTSQSDIKSFFKVLLIFLIVNVLYGIYQHIFGLPEFAKNAYLQSINRLKLDEWYSAEGFYFKIRGFSSHLYDYYYVLSMFLILIITGYKYIRKAVIKTSYLRLFIFTYIVLLFLTLERGPIMMLAVIPLAFIRNPLQFVLFIGLGFLLVLVLSSYEDYLLSLDMERFTRFAQIINPLGEDTTLKGRSETHWVVAMDYIKKNPLGMPNQIAGTGHNNFLMVFMHVGWLMGMFFILLVFSTIFRSFIIAQKIRNTSKRLFAMGLITSMIAMIIMGIPNIPFIYDSAIFYWLFLALIERLPVISQVEQKI